MLKDSGERREAGTGAVRDRAVGKGRCDLLPLYDISILLEDYVLDDLSEDNKAHTLHYILKEIDEFYSIGSVDPIFRAIKKFTTEYYHGDYSEMLLELAKHYEEGAIKYSDRNWEKGIPISWFVDSGIRHLLKWVRGDNDEPHDRAFVWNMLGIIFTMRSHSELDDYTLNRSQSIDALFKERMPND